MQYAPYVLDVSHSSAISSRTTYSCAEFIVTVYSCRNWAVVLYPLACSSNANLCNLYTIILHKPGGAFSSEPHRSCIYIK